MNNLILTNFPTDSFTVKALQKPTGARVVNIDDVVLVQHPQGNHVTCEGGELKDYDAVFVLIDELCPQYLAVIDALEECCKLVVNGGQLYRDTLDELSLHRKLQRANVKFPVSVSVCSPKQAEEVAKTFETLRGVENSQAANEAFPVQVRILVNRHRNGLIKVDSLGGLRTLIEALCEEEIPFVVQEHLHHRGAYTAYVFAGETLAATVTEVGDADDEFRANSLATAANLDSDSQATMARVANMLGRSLIEVTFVKSADGSPVVLDVKPYVRLENLDHSTGQQVAEELAAKLHERVGKLIAPPEVEPAIDEPVAEPTATDYSDDELPSLAAKLELVVYPLNDDKPIVAKLQTEENRHTIYVKQLEGNSNYVSFSFGDYRYRLPRRDSVESFTDSKKSFHHVTLTVKRGEQTFSLPFTLTDEGDSDRADQVWVNPNLLPPTPEELELANKPEKEPEPQEVEVEAPPTADVEVPAEPEETISDDDSPLPVAAEQPSSEAPTNF